MSNLVHRSPSQIFLDKVIEDGQLIRIFLVNGIQLKGFLLRYDEDNLLIDGCGGQLIFRNTIATMCLSNT